MESPATQRATEPLLLLGLENPEVRSLIADELRANGYALSEFEDGEALQRWARRGGETGPDLVVADIELAGRRGVDLLADHRRRGWHTPFVLLSRPNRRKLVGRARRFDQVVVLETPFELDEVSRAVARLLAPEGEREAERRRSPRVPADLRISSVGGCLPVTHSVVDLRAGGMLIRSETLYPVGGVLDLQLGLSGDRSISVRAEVVHVRELDDGLAAGLSFLDGSSAARAAIDGLLAGRS